jgi:hypothetical protein
MLSVMESPRNQQDVRPLPGGKFSTTTLNKSFKGSTSTSSKVVPLRSGLQSIGRSKGTRLLTSLVPAPKFVDLPSIRSETAMSDHNGPGKGNTGWPSNANTGKPSESRLINVDSTGSELSKSGAKGPSSLIVNSGYPTAAEAAKSQSGEASQGESSSSVHTASSNLTRRKSEGSVTELDSKWADAGDEEMDFSHPPVFDEEDVLQNSANTDIPTKSNETPDSDRANAVLPAKASVSDTLALSSSASPNIAPDKKMKADASEARSFNDRRPPSALSAWPIDPRSTSRYRDSIAHPRHLPPSSSQPEREIANWRHRDPHQPTTSSVAPSAFSNRSSRHDRDERHSNERHRYFGKHTPQLLQRSPPLSRALSQHGNTTNHPHDEESHESEEVYDARHSGPKHLHPVIGHQDVRGLSEVRVEIRTGKKLDVSTNMHDQSKPEINLLDTDRAGLSSNLRDAVSEKQNRHLYQPEPYNANQRRELRNRQSSYELRHGLHLSNHATPVSCIQNDPTDRKALVKVYVFKY